MYDWYVFLVILGADIEKRTLSDETALLVATKSGYGECVETLLQWGANITAMTCTGATALHYAIRGGNKEIIRCLVWFGANLHPGPPEYNEMVDAEMYWTSPLNTALRPGFIGPCSETKLHLQITEMLLQHGADVNFVGVNNALPLITAARNGFHKCIKVREKDTISLSIKFTSYYDLALLFRFSRLHIFALHFHHFPPPQHLETIDTDQT